MTQANAQTYDKANSILEIRVDKSSESHVLQRIAHLRNTISEQKDERKMLILRACDDLLGRTFSMSYSHGQVLLNNTKQVLSKPGSWKMLSAATGLLDFTEHVAANS